MLNTSSLPKLRSLTFINISESPHFVIEQPLASQVSSLIRYDGHGDTEEEFLREQLPLFSNLESLTFRDELPFKIGFDAPLNLKTLSILFHHEDLHEYRLAQKWIDSSKVPVNKLKSIKLPQNNRTPIQNDSRNYGTGDKIIWDHFTKLREQIMEEDDREKWRDLLDLLNEEGKSQFLTFLRGTGANR